jgi:uncharacterized protein (DUF885 family)
MYRCPYAGRQWGDPPSEASGTTATSWGVQKRPDGDAYYAFQLRRQTTTELTADGIHEIGLTEVRRIQDDVRRVFASIDYPADGDPVDLI